jgi:hypothetical protein
MQAWRSEVVEKSAQGLETWAARIGLEPSEVRTGTLMRQIAILRHRIDRGRGRIKEEQERQDGLKQINSPVTGLELEVETQCIAEDLQELRTQLETDKSQLKRLETELKSTHSEYETLIAMPPEEQEEWAQAFLGTSENERLAEHVIHLQSEWVDRFGSVGGFVGPLLERSSVIAATCVGLDSVQEADEVEYDLCIIDESSKATAMECCVPMVRARRWILVGDSKQLPPFREEVLATPELREQYELQSSEATESLFERCRRLLPESNRVMLTTQYRMVEPIGRMISDCFYDGKLESYRKDTDKTLSALTGSVVNWISTRDLPTRAERSAGTSYVNPSEAGHICDLLRDLDDRIQESKSPARRSVLVLSGYTKQVEHMERRIRGIRHQLQYLDVECCTIDRVQGRESDVVFFSITRSNSDQSAGFLRALERINVALSRAKDLLFIVGDDRFIERAKDAEPLQKVLAHFRRWPSECFLRLFTAPPSTEEKH